MTTTGERALIGVVVVLILILAISQAVWVKEGKVNPEPGSGLLMDHR